MTSTAHRAPTYFLTKKQSNAAIDVVADLLVWIEIEKLPHPPLKYLAMGLHDIASSSKSAYDDRIHPKIVPGGVPQGMPQFDTPPSDEAKHAFDVELRHIQREIQPGVEWHYPFETLLNYLRALSTGRLLFRSLAKEKD